MEDQASLRMREAAEAVDADDAEKSPSSNGKVKSWLKTKFARRMSRGSKSIADKEKEKSGFIGGAALTGASANNSTVSLSQVPSAAATTSRSGKAAENPAVAPAVVEPTDDDQRIGRSARRASDVSPVSSLHTADEDEFQEARDNFDEDLIPPPTFAAEKSSSPVRDSKFHEVI